MKENEKPDREADSPQANDQKRSLDFDRRTFVKGLLAAGVTLTAGGVGCTPRECCTGLVSSGAGSGGSLSGKALASTPNLVFVFSDTHRNCDWSGGGNTTIQTPNMASLASQGVTFTNCISNQPLCSPFRASLLTGRYPQAHGIKANVNLLGPGLSSASVTLSRILKNNGYVNGYVGKWHLYPGDFEGNLVPAGPDRHGFDDYWRACHNFLDRYAHYTYGDDGKICKLCCPSSGDYSPACQTDMAMGFLESHASQPFCLFLSYDPPHPPYFGAPAQFTDLYPIGSLTARANVPAEEVTQKFLENLQGYYAHISAIDAELGRVMQKLSDLGIADNTIVVYASDHGNMLESHSLLDKEKPWEESINVPFVIRWPAGIAGGRQLPEIFSTVDMAPTLLGLMGFEAPPQAQGLDFSGLLSVGSGPNPESAFIMNILPNVQTTDTKIGDWRGVRTGRYTYVKTIMGGAVTPWLLFDNLNDPYQTVNYVYYSEYAEVRQELDNMLSAWLVQVGDYFGT